MTTVADAFCYVESFLRCTEPDGLFHELRAYAERARRRPPVRARVLLEAFYAECERHAAQVLAMSERDLRFYLGFEHDARDRAVYRERSAAMPWIAREACEPQPPAHHEPREAVRRYRERPRREHDSRRAFMHDGRDE